MVRIRSFNSKAVVKHVSPDMRLTLRGKPGGTAWQFTILVPIGILHKDGSQEDVCTQEDQDAIEDLLARQLGGVTTDTAPVRGVGLREERQETNIHRRMMVLAAQSTATILFFEALRRELEASSGEGQILILREELAVV